MKMNCKYIFPASAPSSIAINENEFVNLVKADIKDNRAVRRTVSIPKWMDDEVTQRGLSLSKVLQDTLKEKFSA
jgi:antitoxin HicB